MARNRENQVEYNAAYYESNRERIRNQQRSYQAANRHKINAARKGLTTEQLDVMIVDQLGRCAICLAQLVILHIDHDHRCCAGPDSCGKCVRGLLCPSCNHMLGKSHDTPEVLETGAAYLRLHAEGVGA